MTIVLCGGGSGGHITPLLAVAAELRARQPATKIIYIGERGGKFTSIARDSKLFDELQYISAGKLRRYHGESALRKLLDIRSIILNIRDLFRFIAGTFQSYFLLRRIKPDAILLKGGFVCVPVAVASNIHHVPYITHDSDALPGLSNKIAARWATFHAVAMPAKYYNYPNESIRTVGVPSDTRFRPYSSSEQAILRSKFHVAKEAQVILVTGGSNGARRLNDAFVKILPALLKKYPKLHVFHQIGSNNEDQIKAFKALYPHANSKVDFFEFSPEIFHMSAIADVVVTRAGASIMTDLGNQKKSCIVVPNPYLTGGHQLKNAVVYDEAKAAVIVKEEQMLSDEEGNLYNSISNLLQNKDLRTKLGENLSRLAPKESAAKAIVDLLTEVSSR